MCQKSLLVGSLLLALSLPVFSQSFSDDQTYQVTGAQLNRLSQDLQTAKSELEKSKTELQATKKDLTTQSELLTTVQTQLQTVGQSLKKSESRTLESELWIGTGCFVLGVVVEALWKKL